MCSRMLHAFDHSLCIQNKGCPMIRLFKYWVPEGPVWSCASVGVNVLNRRFPKREDEMSHSSV